MEIEKIPFSLIDVGASGGIQKQWRRFTNLNYYGFEPDDRDHTPLKKKQNETWFNLGVHGVPGRYPFHLLREQCNSSLLKPNLKTIKNLAYEINDFSVVKVIDIKCDNLDNICRDNKIDPDVIKLDTQGTEHEILLHSEQILKKSVLLAEIEVEFMELYESQKLFSDVDALMRKNGFILMDIGNQLYMKGRNTQSFNLRKGFLVAADALYIKSSEKIMAELEQMSTEKLLAIIPVCEAYGYLNIAYEIFTRIKNDAPAHVYQEISQKVPDILKLIEEHIPKTKSLTISERKFAKIKNFFEKRIKLKNANWNYGIGNPND